MRFSHKTAFNTDLRFLTKLLSLGWFIITCSLADSSGGGGGGHSFQFSDIYHVDVEDSPSSGCKIYASLFLSSSGPHTMVREAFLTDVDVF